MHHAGDGLQPGMFKRTLIRFGKPISAQELNIQDDSSMQLRRASRTIMGRIAQLREESCKELGLPPSWSRPGKPPPRRRPMRVEVAKTAGSALGWTGR
mgnify:CR=1 FL=1